MRRKSVLEAHTLVRHILENITDFSGNIKALGINLRAPMVRGKFIALRVEGHLPGLFLVIEETQVDETHPTGFGIVILVTVEYVDLPTQRIVEKTIVIHVIFRQARIGVQKQAAAPFV
jgi:hypothetical protein